MGRVKSRFRSSIRRIGLSVAFVVPLTLVAAITFGLHISGLRHSTEPGEPAALSTSSRSLSSAPNDYTDPQFGFSVSYPSGFVIEPTLSPGHTLPEGWFSELRAVDGRFKGKESPGEVDFGLRANDAATLNAWIQKHTGPCGSPNSKGYYWDNISNIRSVKVAGRNALSFDWNQQSCGSPLTLHMTAFVMRSSSIFLLSWWSADPAYVGAAHGAAEQMLGSFRG